jgi:hypothetical protein
MDLQLFAEEGGEPEVNPQAGGESAPAENTSGGTILGSAGNNEPAAANSPATNENSQGAPDVYDFSALVPDGMEYDQQAAQEYGAIARECGLSQEQASKIASYGMQFMQNGVNAAMQQVQATYAKWGEDAKAALGADYDKTVSRAAVGINRLEKSIPGLRAAFNETGAGNRIEMIQLLAAFGDLVGEDGGHGVPGISGEKSLYPNTNFGQYR